MPGTTKRTMNLYGQTPRLAFCAKRPDQNGTPSYADVTGRRLELNPCVCVRICLACKTTDPQSHWKLVALLSISVTDWRLELTSCCQRRPKAHFSVMLYRNDDSLYCVNWTFRHMHWTIGRPIHTLSTAFEVSRLLTIWHWASNEEEMCLSERDSEIKGKILRYENEYIHNIFTHTHTRLKRLPRS